MPQSDSSLGSMHEMDKKLLDRIQSDFPLTSRPYATLGDELGMTEAETLARVRALKGKGVIRRVGANFQSRKLGFRSTLCAAHVPPESLDDFIAEVNRHPGVTHNYLREHYYNVWFTYIGPSWEAVCADLAAMERETGVTILNLPATRMYKIKVEFRMD